MSEQRIGLGGLRNARHFAKFGGNENDKMSDFEQSTAAELAVEMVDLVFNNILANRDGVSVEIETTGFTASTVNIKADRRNFGAILGVRAATTEALKAIVRGVGTATGVQVQATLTEIPQGERKRRPSVPISDDWDRERFERDMQRLFEVLFSGQAEVRVIDEKGGRTIVEVICSERTNIQSTEVLRDKLSPLITEMGFRHGRRMFLSLARDQMLYEAAAVAVH